MRRLRNRIRRDESGAALILAIAFMIVVGGISAAVVSATTSGLNGRTVLDQARNREYAADGAIESSIATMRGALPNTGAITSECSTTPPPWSLNGVSIHVDCAATSTVAGAPAGTLDLQNDVVFTACVNTGSACASSNVIIRAQVNFQGTGSASAVTPIVQAWSVNG